MPKKKEDDSVKVTSLSDVTYITTGVEEVDTLLGGGWARGRITELWGNPGTGKSFLLGKTMASMEGKTLYIDSEFSLYKPRLEDIGVNLDKVDIVQDGRLERVTEHVIEAVGKYDLIIIDSLAKFIPMSVSEQNVGENSIGLFARQVKHFEAKLKPRLAISKTALVVINQARAGMGMYAPSKPQGGFAWEHAIDIRVKLSKKGAWEKQVDGVKTRVGHEVEVEVQKSRLTKPYIKTTFRLTY